MTSPQSPALSPSIDPPHEPTLSLHFVTQAVPAADPTPQGSTPHLPSAPHASSFARFASDASAA
jgi:hypothetical protein